MSLESTTPCHWIDSSVQILDNVYKESALTPEEKVRKLQQLHPEGDAIRIPEADFPRTGVVEKSEVRLATEKLSRGASPGPTGLSESMMRLLVDDEESCLSLCHMLRDVINGEVPLNVRKRLTRCRIIALAKSQNGIRPIAMGDTILKICGAILLQRHENALQNFFSPTQRGILQKNACESIVHELLNEYEEGHALLTVDFSNAYNTPQRNAIAEALLGNPIFKPFMRLFYLEYGIPSELLFFAHNALFATIESSSGIRQGSALSSMYFCALLQGPLRELMHLYPDVKIRAYQDDVTLSSKNVQALEAAFFTCCSSYAKHTSSALMQQVSDRKYKKYVTEKGVDSDSFKCLAATDCGLLHDDTKALLKALSQRAKLKYESVRNAFHLEIEKMSAYTVVSQLRDYIPAEKWMSELRL